MNKLSRILLTVSALVVALFGGLSFYFAAQEYVADSVIFNTSKNIAINGYDTVAYYGKDGPKVGLPEFQADWAGSTWYFSDIKNRDSFAKNPERYAPQFGGYDPLRISLGYTNPSDPEQYTVFAGMLFLHYSEDFKTHWNADRGKNMILATSNWNYIRANLLSAD